MVRADRPHRPGPGGGEGGPPHADPHNKRPGHKLQDEVTGHLGPGLPFEPRRGGGGQTDPHLPRVEGPKKEGVGENQEKNICCFKIFSLSTLEGGWVPTVKRSPIGHPVDVKPPRHAPCRLMWGDAWRWVDGWGRLKTRGVCVTCISPTYEDHSKSNMNGAHVPCRVPN